jgi:predicted small secreted protein
MKKLIVIVIALCLMLALAGCNRAIGPGNYVFRGIHVSDCSGNARDLTVKSWHDNETGIEINTEEVGSIFCSEGTYILYEGQCPICSGKAG